MAVRDVVDAAYRSTASFGRDVFHYIVTGTAFVFVCGVSWWPKEPASLPATTGVQLAILFLTVIVLFCLGHVLLAAGFLIRKLVWMRLCCEHVRRYEEAVKRVKRCNGNQGGAVEPRDAHVVPEMTVFVQRHDIHATFIERYNTLWHLRLGMGTSLICAGVFSLAISGCWSNWPKLAIAVGIGAILAGVVLMRQHLVTNTSFLNRVAAGLQVVQQDTAEGARPNR